MNIAVVDDNTQIREKISSVISHQIPTSNIFHYENGEEFLSEYKIQKNSMIVPFTLVVMDEYLGEDSMSGAKTVAEMRKNGIRDRVLLFSNDYLGPEIGDSYLAVDKYLSKSDVKGFIGYLKELKE